MNYFVSITEKDDPLYMMLFLKVPIAKLMLFEDIFLNISDEIFDKQDDVADLQGLIELRTNKSEGQWKLKLMSQIMSKRNDYYGTNTEDKGELAQSYRENKEEYA